MNFLQTNVTSDILVLFLNLGLATVFANAYVFVKVPNSIHQTELCGVYTLIELCFGRSTEKNAENLFLLQSDWVNSWKLIDVWLSRASLA